MIVQHLGVFESSVSKTSFCLILLLRCHHDAIILQFWIEEIGLNSIEQGIPAGSGYPYKALPKRGWIGYLEESVKVLVRGSLDAHLIREQEAC